MNRSVGPEEDKQSGRRDSLREASAKVVSEDDRESE